MKKNLLIIWKKPINNKEYKFDEYNLVKIQNNNIVAVQWHPEVLLEKNIKLNKYYEQNGFTYIGSGNNEAYYYNLWKMKIEK